MPARWSPRPIRTTFRATAGHLLAAAHAAFWPATIGCGVIVGLALLVVTRGSYVTWGGLESIPVGS